MSLHYPPSHSSSLSYPPSQSPPTAQIQTEWHSRHYPTASQMQTEQHYQPYPPAARPPPPPIDLYRYQPCPTNAISPVVLNRQFGQTPVPLRCPICQKDVVTELVYESGTMVWIAVGIIFLLSLFVIIPLFFFWIPFLVDDFKDINHTCPNCCYVFGKYKRI